MPTQRVKVLKSNRKPGKYSGAKKFVSYGEELIEKQVSSSGVSGRIYLPQDWVGKKVRIIRVD